MKLDDCQSDSKVFERINRHYQSLPRRSWYFLFFRTLISIDFVKFQLYPKDHSVDIIKKGDLPPQDDNHYEYAPRPMEPIPPVSAKQLLHFFHSPDCADDTFRCLRRVPKKKKEPLTVCDVNPDGIGWGLQLVEGLDSRRMWIVCFVVFILGSFLFGVLWKIFEKSIQDAFAVSGYLVAAAVVTIGFFQALA